MSSTQSGPNLQKEIEEFGRQIAESFRVARQTARGKEIEQQVKSALGDAEKFLTDAYNAVRAQIDTPEFKDQVGTTAKNAADEVQNQLAIGLRAVNEKIKTLLEEKKQGK